jgi:CHAT domain-containing protein
LSSLAGDAPSTSAFVLTGSGATEAALREQFARAGTLHVAAPFRVNAASPLFSPILLADTPEPASPGNDGVLELREVMNLQLPARAAVVSDPAALSMRDAAGESAVVQWAWRAAGAQRVVLQRWAADDGAGGAVVAALYARLRRGEDAPEALAGARQSVRRMAGRSAPAYWAGWFSLGEP